MDLALNNLQRLICHKTQPTNQLYTGLTLCMCGCVHVYGCELAMGTHMYMGISILVSANWNIHLSIYTVQPETTQRSEDCEKGGNLLLEVGRD